MNLTIRKLPDILINQIAAGEVVERPASVVKELVENSLDAGATHILVEMEAGGKKRLKVLDNGVGMTKEAAELALQRHATSKLRTLDDLFELTTMGFRGEALPSIAAVSKMTLTTRPRHSPDCQKPISAHCFQIEGGEIIYSSDVGAPSGTQIEISDLFYNVPARQKFLKGEGTEAAHVADVVMKLALANPTVHVRLKNHSRTALNAPLHKDYADRVRVVMGARLGSAPYSATGEYGGVRVHVVLGTPEVAQTTTRGFQLFVGRRAVRDTGVLRAVIQGYEERIAKGRYPVAVVRIELPGEAVDVNVHPQKLEVRFSDPQLVYAAVRQTVRAAILEAGWDMSSTGYSIGSTVEPASKLAASYAKEQTKNMFPRANKLAKNSADLAVYSAKDSRQATSTRAYAPPSMRTSPPVMTTKESLEAREPSLALSFRALCYLGSLEEEYWICTGDAALVLVHRRRARLRAKEATLTRWVQGEKRPCQKLLSPISFEMSERRRVSLKACDRAFHTLGFFWKPVAAESMEDKGYLVSVPGFLNVQSSGPEAIFQKVLERMDAAPSPLAQEELIRTLAEALVDDEEELTTAEVLAIFGVLDDAELSADELQRIACPLDLPSIARRFR